MSPKSPLRHVILPGEEEEEHIEQELENDDADFDFLPLNTFVFGESNWLDSAPVSLGGRVEEEAGQQAREEGVGAGIREDEGRKGEDENMIQSANVTTATPTTTTTSEKSEDGLFGSGNSASLGLCSSPEMLSAVLSTENQNDTPKVGFKDEQNQGLCEDASHSVIMA